MINFGNADGLVVRSSYPIQFDEFDDFDDTAEEMLYDYEYIYEEAPTRYFDQTTLTDANVSTFYTVLTTYTCYLTIFHKISLDTKLN